MNAGAKPNRLEVLALVLRSLETMLAGKEIKPPLSVGESTPLIGAPAALLDSLGMIMLFVDIEHELEERFGRSVLLAADSTMFQEDSNVETVGSLTDHVYHLMDKGMP